MLELGVFLCGTAYGPALSLLENAGSLSFITGFPRSFLLVLYHSAALTLIIGVPSALMGATLPAGVDAWAGAKSSPGRSLAWLYGANTMGAVVGSLLTGFYLIETFGLTRSTWIAAALNLVASTIGWQLWSQSRSALASDLVSDPGSDSVPDSVSDSRPSVTPQPDHCPDSESSQSLDPTILIPHLILAGFLSMSYEVTLIRLLTLVLSTSSYAFCLIVSSFIAGISAGSILAGRISRDRSRSRAALAFAPLAASAMFGVFLCVFNEIPLWFHWSILQFDADFRTVQVVTALFLFFVMSLPALFLGMFLPLAVGLCRSGESDPGRLVAVLYAYNTLGNIAGTAATGLWLLPGLGAEWTLKITIIFGIIMSSSLHFIARPARPFKVLTGSLLVGVIVFALPHIDFRLFTHKIYGMPRDEKPSLDAIRKSLVRDRNILLQAEDDIGVVTVEQGDRGIYRSLRINGRVSGSTSRDMSTQKLVAHLPLLAHPDPQTVFIVGAGTGITPAAALCHPVRKVTTVEISRAVAAACRLFEPITLPLRTDARSALVVDDARHVLKLSPNLYDVIISEPPNPWVAGISNLFTVEFFQLVRSRLTTRGVFGQWVQGYEIGPETLQLIFRIFPPRFSARRDLSSAGIRIHYPGQPVTDRVRF